MAIISEHTTICDGPPPGWRRAGGDPREIGDSYHQEIVLRAATGMRSGETCEPQDWSEGRAFLGNFQIEKEGPALETARNWRARDTTWTEGS